MPGRGNAAQRKAEEQGENGNLQYLIVRDGMGDVVGEDMEEKQLPGGRGLQGGGVRYICGWNRDADPGMRKMDGDEADDEGSRGEHFKVEQRFPAETPHAGRAAVARDAGHQRSEDERRNDGADEAQKDVGEDAGGKRGMRQIEAVLNAENHGEENGEGERAPPENEGEKQCERGQTGGGSTMECVQREGDGPEKQSRHRQKQGCSTRSADIAAEAHATSIAGLPSSHLLTGAAEDPSFQHSEAAIVIYTDFSVNRIETLLDTVHPVLNAIHPPIKMVHTTT